MKDQQNVIDCYGKTAVKYAGKFFNELEHKHFDRLLLTSFALENKDNGKMIDLGCGPGQTTNFLHACGVKELIGTDLSPAMVREAVHLNPGLEFETADMLGLQYAGNTFGAAVAFYAIVHFDEPQLLKAFSEINRVLKPGGQFLLSFHIGSQVVHYDSFLDQAVNIDFHFWEIDKIKETAFATGFTAIDIISRQPYPDIEYPTQRAYVWLQKA